MTTTGDAVRERSVLTTVRHHQGSTHICVAGCAQKLKVYLYILFIYLFVVAPHGVALQEDIDFRAFSEIERYTD